MNSYCGQHLTFKTAGNIIYKIKEGSERKFGGNDDMNKEIIIL